jgi:hypothetical protein
LKPQPQKTVQRPKNVVTSVTNNSFGGKVQNKKEKKGLIGISDSSPDGKFIVIENCLPKSNHHEQSSSSQQQQYKIELSGWQVKRKVDCLSDEILFRIPQGVYLDTNSSLTIWAKPFGYQKARNDIVADLDNWGIGINSLTLLYNGDGEEKSIFQQQITFNTQY